MAGLVELLRPAPQLRPTPISTGPRPFAQSYVYDLPLGVGKKWLNQGVSLPASWAAGRSTRILMAVTGTPLTFGANGASCLNTPGTPQTADQAGPYAVLGGINVPAQGGSPYFAAVQFRAAHRCCDSAPPAAISCPVPDLYNLDASIFKLVSINERIRVEAARRILQRPQQSALQSTRTPMSPTRTTAMSPAPAAPADFNWASS